MTNEPKPAPRPTILTKIEALTYAAEQLERMATDCELAAIILGALKDREIEGPDAERLRDLRNVMREPDLQAAALREGAKVIRDLVLEERLVAARVSAHAASTGNFK